MSEDTEPVRVISIPVESPEGKPHGPASAHTLSKPTTQAAATMMHYPLVPDAGEMTVKDVIGELQTQCKAVTDGDLDRAEAMLMAQAHTLDAIFNNLARRAARNFGEYLDAGERYLKLAMRAQSQCRASLETLGAIKNPPNVAFVKQANIANGNQQVNNGAMPTPPARTEETSKTPIKLLEATNGERLDIGATTATRRGDQALATVGAIDRTEDGGGKGESEPQRLQGRRATRVA